MTKLIKWPTAFILLIAIIVISFSSSFFNLKKIEVKTEWPLKAEVIGQKISVFKNKNLFFLNLRQLNDELSSMSWVKKVFIKKQLPDTIFVKVESEKPVAILREGKELFYLNCDGKVIGSWKSLKNSNYPIISVEKTIKSEWHILSVLSILDTLLKEFKGNNFKISELVLMHYPYFKIFLTSPRLEIEFDQTHWETQLPILNTLLGDGAGNARRFSKINLVLLKKAIVNSVISK